MCQGGASTGLAIVWADYFRIGLSVVLFGPARSARVETKRRPSSIKGNPITAFLLFYPRNLNRNHHIEYLVGRKIEL